VNTPPAITSHSNQSGRPNPPTECQACGVNPHHSATIVTKNIRCGFAIGPQKSCTAPAAFPIART